ncbi:membrane protein implicated in regulation of membrane protease activity [Microbacteriaceae bacterium SG_E_30_P1]|uniref:Membrane protein implicated in regulation of membrane protease activity n=1 Tax=Antiquaquibacter oligotrophicus TaxID=2880260 RepID=A0ABT6KQJ2_9MICO|nr:phage holin family protein [Antiquaquibacter oligotrophicus]MDH6182249.1 membrane protein implicated in regulation of membrane protease activity [Antiquaquibacter oligotrophicus]UDF12092.1 phage holin family protein [Antiquaquibacter oligotrophicus]
MSGVPPRPKRSLFALIADLPGYLVDLLRAELDQLKKELAQRAAQAGIGIGFLVGAGLFLFFALAAFITAAILGLGEVLPAWAAALIVAGALLVIAGILVAIGIASLKKGAQGPKNTVESIKKDVSVIQGTGRRD